MKKIKYLLILLIMIPFIVKAEELEIKDMFFDYNQNSAILYNNSKLLLSETIYGETPKLKTIDNVKKFVFSDYESYSYLTNDGVLHVKSDTYENVKDYVRSKTYDSKNDLFYLDTDNKLYYLCPNQFNCSNLSNLENNLISENVKSFIAVGSEKITLLFLTNDNELYFLGENYFGSKINSSNEVSEPFKLLDNIVDYNENYALNSNGDLYIFYSKDPRPTVHFNNVEEVISDKINKYYGDNLISLIIKNKDNSYKYIYYQQGIKSKNLDITVKKLVGDYILTKDGKIYWIDKNIDDNEMFYYIDNDVKDISEYRINKYDNSFIYLKNNNEVYHVNGYYINRYNKSYEVDDIVKRLYNADIAYKPVLFLKNVKSIKYAYLNYIILNDNSIYRIGYGENGIFFGPPYKESRIPVQINDLINNDKEIKSNQIYLSFKDVYDYSVGEEFDAYATVLPYNGVNKELIWESSDTNVASVDNDGYIITKNVGRAIISVKTSDGSVREQATINVHPQPDGISFENGSNITIERDKKVELKAIVTPDNTLKKNVKWEIINNKEHCYLESEYYDEELKEYFQYDNNKRVFEANNGGTYQIKVTTEDNKYSSIITINVIEKAEYIKLSIPESNYDGYNAFIFLFENNSFKVTATVGNENATNKNVIFSSNNKEIADIAQNGIITGKKPGRAIIKIESEDGGASRQFNVIVYDKNGNGDANSNKITSAPVIKVKDGIDNTIDITWNQILNASEYLVYSSTDNKKWTKIATTSELFYKVKSLTYGKKYYFKVKAQNSSNYKTSAVVSGKTNPNKVKLSIASASTNNVKLSWDKVNTTGYEVYMNGKKITTITKNGTLTYNKTKLKANTTYKFKVRAYKTVSKKKIYGPFSSELSTKTAPVKPSLSLSLKTLTEMNIKIGSVNGASKYTVQKSLDGKTYELLEDLTGAKTLVASELEIGKIYYYRVRACNIQGRCSGWVTKSLKQTTKTPSYSLKTTSKKVTITLKSVEGADGYEIHRATKKKGKYTKVKELTSESELVYNNKTKKGTTYYYKVRSYKMVDGEKVYSPFSSIKSIKSK